MQKKVMIISWLVSFILINILVIKLVKDLEKEANIKSDFAQQRIECFSKKYFRFLEDCKIDMETENMAVSISFVPEVGSFPIKEEIYRNIAYHALQIVSFFPEVNQFNYVVLWDDNMKEEVLTLTIDESDIKNLSDTFWTEYMNQSNGFETSYRNVFSSIIETEESESWRDNVNIFADIP